MSESPALAHAAAVLAWERHATAEDRLDLKGRPVTPTCYDPEDPQKVLGLVDDDGELFTPYNFHSVAQIDALAAFVATWYRRPA